MLLNELTGVKHLNGRRAEDILKYLKAHHGIESANGAWGLVLKHSSWDYVLKMFIRDDPYLDFIKFTKQHPNNHYPRFGQIKKLTSFFKTTKDEAFDDKLIVVKIEKLQPITPEVNRYLTMLSHPEHGNLNWFKEQYPKIAKIADKREKRRAMENLADKIWWADLHKVDEVLGFSKGFADALYALMESSGEYGIDFAPRNFLMRGSDVVITDPFYDKHYAEIDRRTSVMLSKILNLNFDGHIINTIGDMIAHNGDPENLD